MYAFGGSDLKLPLPLLQRDEGRGLHIASDAFGAVGKINRDWAYAHQCERVRRIIERFGALHE